MMRTGMLSAERLSSRHSFDTDRVRTKERNSLNDKTDFPSLGAGERFTRIHAEIRDRICLLQYAPGTRLSEEALAAEFGISRTPLRRVIARLEGEGLVQSVHGVGTFVTDFDIEELAQTYRLRVELAGLVGRLDPIEPDDGLRGEFRRLSERSRDLKAAPDPLEFTRLNMEFFLALSRLTRNEPLRQINERLYFKTTRIWLQSVTATRIDLSEEIEIFDREVQDVVRAIEIGNLPAVALIQSAHISMSFTRMRKGLER